MKAVLALSWFEHRRMSELCAGLGIELVVLTSPHRGLVRYLTLAAKTLVLLVRRRPSRLLVQNPSLVLALLGVLGRSVFGYRLIVDAHNEAIIPFVNPRPSLVRIARWLVQRADLTLVTNRQLASRVTQQGGRPYLLPDRVPVPPRATVRNLGPRFNIVFICTYAPDEPLAELFAAVRELPVDLYVTGDHRKLGKRIEVPANVHVTGYLSEQEYWDLLASADAIIDLTLMPDCLVCGAYEALALGKPMLLSNNAASMELFAESACYTDNTVEDIRRGIDRMMTEREQLQTTSEMKRAQMRADWEISAAELGRLVRGRFAPLAALHSDSTAR